MKIKKILIIPLILTIVLNFDIVKAEEKKELIKQFSSSENLTYYNSSSKVRTTFFKDGIVFYTKNVKEKDNLFYYNVEGNLITSKKIEDLANNQNLYIEYMEAHDDYLYLLTNVGIYKLDSFLEIVAFNSNFGYSYYSWSERERLDYGIRQMEFTEEGIYLQDGIFIDYDLKELKRIDNNEKYIKLKGVELSSGNFEPVYNLKSVCELPEFSEESCDRVGEYTVASSGYFYSDAYLHLYRNNEKLWTLSNEDYNKFMHVKLYNNIIIAVAGKYDKNIYNYKNDILFYDLEGKYLGKIEENQILSYLTVSEEKVALGREVIDGICDGDKYSMSDSGCDSITTFDVYALGTSKVNPSEDGNSSGINITNPETSSTKISYIFIILLGALSIGLLIRKKIKL